WWVEEDPNMEFRQTAIVDAFEQEHPGIELVMEPAPGGDLDRVIATALQAGAGPDIVPSGGPTRAANLAQAGLLMDLSDASKRFGWDTKLLSWALGSGTFEGELYQLPQEFECTIAFYGQQQFDKNGWSLPTNRQEFEALAEE